MEFLQQLRNAFMNHDWIKYQEILAQLPIMINWNHIGQQVLKSDDPTLFDFIYQHLAINQRWDWNNLLVSTLFSPVDPSYLFQHIVNLVPRNYQLNWQGFAQIAILNNSIEVFNMILRLAPNEFDWDWLGAYALRSNDCPLEKFNYIEKLAPKDYNWDFNLLAKSALRSNINPRRLFDYIYSLGFPDYEWNYNELASAALLSKQNPKELFDYIYSLGFTDYHWDYNYLAQFAALSISPGYLLLYIKNLAPVNYKWNLNEIRVAILNNRGDIRLLEILPELFGK